MPCTPLPLLAAALAELLPAGRHCYLTLVLPQAQCSCQPHCQTARQLPLLQTPQVTPAALLQHCLHPQPQQQSMQQHQAHPQPTRAQQLRQAAGPRCCCRRRC
jgi:hypothetical protein